MNSLRIAFLNELEHNCLRTVRWFKVFIYIPNNSIQHQYFEWVDLNGSTVFTNGPGDRGSIPGRAIPKT